MMEGLYFFDTYAIIEMFDGNKRYAKYRDARALVTNLNLFELDYCLQRRGVKGDEVSALLNQYSEYLVGYGTSTVRNAVSMKLANRQLSPVDCIGYQVAQEFGAKFLTGDKEFEDLPGVEYVK